MCLLSDTRYAWQGFTFFVGYYTGYFASCKRYTLIVTLHIAMGTGIWQHVVIQARAMLVANKKSRGNLFP
jgi:F0F1-type ATP synthase assembly protein I